MEASGHVKRGASVSSSVSAVSHVSKCTSVCHGKGSGDSPKFVLL